VEFGRALGILGTGNGKQKLNNNKKTKKTETLQFPAGCLPLSPHIPEDARKLLLWLMC
jgi:hypothetical protein